MVRSSIGQEPVSTTTMDTLPPCPTPPGLHGRDGQGGGRETPSPAPRQRGRARSLPSPAPSAVPTGGRTGCLGCGNGEGTHNPGLPLHWLFLLSPAETIHPRAGTIPWGLVIFAFGFFPFPDWGGRRPAASERGQGVGRPARETFSALSASGWVTPKPTVPSMRQSLGELRTVFPLPELGELRTVPLPRTW